MSRWVDARRNRHEIAPNTWRAAHSHIRAITAHFGAATPINVITTEDLEDWIELLHVQPRSRNTMFGTYRQFFAHAHRRRWIDRNPVADIRNAKVPVEDPRHVPARDVAAIAGAAPLRSAVLIIVDAHLGLRRSELAALRIDDYNPAAGTVHVRSEGAKGSRERTVAVRSEAAWALNAWLARLAQDGHTTGPMWPSRQAGRGLSPGRIYTLIVEASHQLGMHYTPHQYRHTMGTTMALEGAPLEVIRRQMGHRDISTTGRYTYAAVDDIRPHVARTEYTPGRWSQRS